MRRLYQLSYGGNKDWRAGFPTRLRWLSDGFFFPSRDKPLELGSLRPAVVHASHLAIALTPGTARRRQSYQSSFKEPPVSQPAVFVASRPKPPAGFEPTLGEHPFARAASTPRRQRGQPSLDRVSLAQGAITGLIIKRSLSRRPKSLLLVGLEGEPASQRSRESAGYRDDHGLLPGAHPG